MEGRARHLQLIKNLLDTGGSFVYSVYIEVFRGLEMEADQASWIIALLILILLFK